MLVESGIDYNDKRNLVISSVVLVIGVGGAALRLKGIHLDIEGMALATIVGIILNLILPNKQIEETAEDSKIVKGTVKTEA